MLKWWANLSQERKESFWLLYGSSVFVLFIIWGICVFFIDFVQNQEDEFMSFQVFCSSLIVLIIVHLGIYKVVEKYEYAKMEERLFGSRQSLGDFFGPRQLTVEGAAYVKSVLDEDMQIREREVSEMKWKYQALFQKNLVLLNEMKEAEEWNLAIQFCNSMQDSGEGIVGSYSDWWSSKWRGEIKMIEEVMAPPRRSRHIPTHVKREVWERDRGRCVHCGSSEDIHYDHDIPFSKGGSHGVENIQLLCAKCNLKKGSKII